MGKKKTTRITVITEEVWAFRGPAKVAKVWCAECAADVPVAPAERVAALLGVSARAIYRQVENKEVHYREAPDGRLFVCLNSAQAAARLLPTPRPLGE